MRLTPLRLALLFGAALLLLGPTSGLTQPGGKGGQGGAKGGAKGGGKGGGKQVDPTVDPTDPNAGGFGGGKGGKGGKGGGKGGPGGGGPGGGGPGGGGPGGKNGKEKQLNFTLDQADPNQIFNILSAGQDFIVIQSISDQELRNRAVVWAETKGINDGMLYRDDFTEFWKDASKSMGVSSANSQAQDRAAENLFRRMDRDRSDFLDETEMSDALLAVWEFFDADGDGLINLEEFKDFYKSQNGTGRGPLGAMQNGDEKRSTVYHAGSLPKELPPWFAQLDTDKDAQVGLYEWKRAQRNLEEFLLMDKNGDGFITVEEVLYYQRSVAKKNAGPGSVLGGNLPSMGAQGQFQMRGQAGQQIGNAIGNLLQNLGGGRGGAGGGRGGAGGGGGGPGGGGGRGGAGGGAQRGGGAGGANFGGGGANFGGGGGFDAGQILDLFQQFGGGGGFGG